MQEHPFFASVPWDCLYLQRSPYVPRVEHELDTQNFEQYDEGPDAVRGAIAAGTKRWGSRTDPTFIGYTFKNWEAVSGSPSARLKFSGRPNWRLQLHCVGEVHWSSLHGGPRMMSIARQHNTTTRWSVASVSFDSVQAPVKCTFGGNPQRARS